MISTPYQLQIHAKVSAQNDIEKQMLLLPIKQLPVTYPNVNCCSSSKPND